MKTPHFIFENTKGETVRILNWSGSKLSIIKIADRPELDFIANISDLDQEKRKFDLIATVEKDQITAKPFAIRGYGHLKAVSEITKYVTDVDSTKEDEDQFPLYLKYTAGGYVAALLLLLSVSWLIGRFLSDEQAQQPIVVQVEKQERTFAPIVNVQEKVYKNTQVSNRTVIAKSKKHNKSLAQNGKGTQRPGNSLKFRGALGALGGYSKDSTGRGGLSVTAKTTGGLGYQGEAARGSSRGLVGKGLIKSGAGRGYQLHGYDGYGTSGQGGSQRGYGIMKTGGSSGAYFSPLADQSIVEGGLDRDQINAVIQRNIGQVIYCYENELQKKPDLSGRVAVNFVINGKGYVNAANVARTSLGSSRVESCIVSKLKNWKFPQPTGSVSVRVTYPFVLKRLSRG